MQEITTTPSVRLSTTQCTLHKVPPGHHPHHAEGAGTEPVRVVRQSRLLSLYDLNEWFMTQAQPYQAQNGAYRQCQRRACSCPCT